MNKLVHIAFIAILLASCTKEKSIQKNLPGTWKIVYYKFTDNQGFNYYPEFEGKFFFENNSTSATYSIGLTLTHPKINLTRVETGTYKVRDIVKFDLHETNGNGTTTPHLNYEILFISKSDLKILFVDSLNCVHTLTLEK